MELRKYELERCYFYHYNINFFDKTEILAYVTDTGAINNSTFNSTEAYDRLD
jgi:hypothetical protein